MPLEWIVMTLYITPRNILNVWLHFPNTFPSVGDKNEPCTVGFVVPNSQTH